jgi:hypothetical protein
MSIFDGSVFAALTLCTGDVSFEDPLESKEFTSDEMLIVSYDKDSDIVVSLSLATIA